MKISRAAIISCSVSFLLLLALFWGWEGIRPDILWGRIAWPLMRLVAIMAVSLGLSALIEGMGWNSIVASLARPLMRAGNFSDYAGTAFTSAFLSGVAANTLLWNAYQEKRISYREMMLATLLNLGLPSYFLHLPVTFAIIVPLAGSAGAIYITITLLAAVLRTFVVLIAGRLLLGTRTVQQNNSTPAQENSTSHEGSDSGTGHDRYAKVKKLFARYIRLRLGKIVCYTVPIYLFVAWLQQAGVFHWMQQASTSLFTAQAMPVEGISVVVFSIMAEFAAGAAAAGAMLNAGVLTIKQTVYALLLGNIIATPVRALRHQLPRYLGIYQPKTGIMLLLLGQGLRVTSVVITGWLYYIS